MSKENLRHMASHPHRATIDPIPSGVERPLWSVMIPTYNCARYLTRTLESVLSQDPGAGVIQIEVVDDCSTTDDPEAVVRSVGHGRVSFFRQPKNGGHVRNFETCLNRSRGRLIHLLHGDDYVLHGFYTTMSAAFAAHPELGLATCRHMYAGPDGHWFGISRLRQQQSGLWANALAEVTIEGDLQTASVVARRDCYEALGGFDDRLLCTEDYEMWARIASRFPVWYETECLAVYRMHGGSNSARDAATAENIRDMRRSVEIVASEVTAELPPGWSRKVLRKTARAAINRAAAYFDEQKTRSALLVLREAVRTDTGPGTIARAMRCVLRAVWKRLTGWTRPKERLE